MKPWNELKITDDYIFCKVMQNESICRQMLELLLNIKIDQLERSMDYRHLKESYVIFICTFDPFNHDSLIYTVKQNFLERPDKSYDDNTRKVFYNLNASELKREDSRLGTFLRYLITNDPEDVFTKQISKEVESVKHSTKWRKEYMTVGEWIREEVEKEVAIEIDKRVATEVDKRVASEVDKRVANEVEKRVSNEVEKQVAIKLEKEVNKKVATEVENQLHAQQLQNARNLLAMNVLTAEQIAQAVELPVEEVLSLK